MLTDPNPAEVETYLRDRARQYGVDPDLIVRQARQESGLRQSARSPVGATGVMQLMPGTARELGVDPNDWRQNIDGGVRYMAQQLQTFGDPELALAAYNAGPGNARARGRNWDQYREETRGYIRNILGAEPGANAGGNYRVVASTDLTPEEQANPDLLRAQGYELDPATNTWARVVGREDVTPLPLDRAYERRQAERDNLVMDQEDAELERLVLAGAGVSDNMAMAVARDVGTGIFAEGGQAVVSGVKRGFNATMDLIDEAGDWIETYVPGTIQWEGIDGDASTPFRIRLTTQNAAEARMTDEATNRRPNWLQRLGMGQVRAPTNEAERPETVTGRLIEGISQFATGFAGGGQVLRGWQVAGRAGQIGKSLAQGALADFTAFDGQEERLSNLLAEVAPDAIAPAFEFLAADEDDPELLGRFKNAVEGTILGGVVDVLGVGVRRLRAARQVRTAARDAARAEGLQIDPTLPASQAQVMGEQAQATVRQALGNAEGPRYRVRASEAAGGGREAPIVRFRRLAAPIERAMPSIPEGSTRLWRGERPGADGQGLNFTNDLPGIALPFREAYGGNLNYVDIPTSRLAELEMKGAAARGAEFHLPPDLAAQAKPAPLQPVAAELQVKTEAVAPSVRAANIDPATVTAPSANVFDINLARIDTPDDVRAVITGMADRLRGDVDLARRATRSWEETQAAANGVDWVSSMAARRPGQAVNAEEITAYRMALNASATKVLELARQLTDGTARRSEGELSGLQLAFRRATTVHAAIQNEFMGARAEAGRALNAMKIPVGTPERALRQMDSLLADFGGAKSTDALAKAMLKASENGDVALNQLMRNGAMARSRDIIKLVYTNGLLSGLGTPIINAVGSPLAMTMDLTSRWIAPRLARAFGGTSTTRIGEAGAVLHGYQQALRDIFALNPAKAAQRIGFDSVREQGVFRGLAPGLDDAGDRLGVDLRPGREEAGGQAGASNMRPLSAGAWGVAEDSVLGRVLDTVQLAVEAPSNINALADDFYKVIAARGELHAQAFRRAMAEGLEGREASARIADLIDNPTDDMLAAAEKQMNELTFTRADGKFEKALGGVRRMIDENSGPVPAATFMALPFLRTPLNLTSLAVRYSPLAPLSARFRSALAAGGAEAETAKAQMALGSALWSVWMGMALEGQISGGGPGSPEQKQAMMRADEIGRVGWQPYSVRFGDRWYSYERADPLGTALSLIGDFAELVNNDDWTGANFEEASEIAANAVVAIGAAFFDKTVLRSAFEFTEAMTSGDVALAERYIMNKASSMLPASSFNRMLRRGADPYMRETHNVVTALKNTIPGLSDELPVSRDLWGQPRTYQTGLGTVYDAIVPVQTREAGGSAIDAEILANGVGVRMPPKSIDVMGASVSLKNRPDIYSRLLELSGQPAFEHLNAVAEGSHPDSEYYFSLPDGPGGDENTYAKGDYILDTMRAYRSDARLMVMDEYAADLQALAARRLARREEVRLDR